MALTRRTFFEWLGAIGGVGGDGSADRNGRLRTFLIDARWPLIETPWPAWR